MEDDLFSEQDNTTVQSTEDKIDVLRSFITSFEVLPELWDPNHGSYKNKFRRKESLKKLLPIYKKIKPNANETDVKNKLNSLRTNYRKELKKIIASKRSGSGTEDVYKPTSWVFHALQFLGKSELPVGHHSLEQSEVSFIASGWKLF